jgi:hypothetical protein
MYCCCCCCCCKNATYCACWWYTAACCCGESDGDSTWLVARLCRGTSCGWPACIRCSNGPGSAADGGGGFVDGVVVEDEVDGTAGAAACNVVGTAAAAGGEAPVGGELESSAPGSGSWLASGEISN